MDFGIPKTTPQQDRHCRARGLNMNSEREIGAQMSFIQPTKRMQVYC